MTRLNVNAGTVHGYDRELYEYMFLKTCVKVRWEGMRRMDWNRMARRSGIDE